ncbi:hypothetical protein D3C72_1492410 [compost metagenome]
MADQLVGHGKHRLLRLIHPWGAGVKAQVLAGNVVGHAGRQPDRRVVIRQCQQYAGGGEIQRLPAVGELMQRDNYARLAHGFQEATKTVLGILHGVGKSGLKRHALSPRTSVKKSTRLVLISA